jgi:Probable sensor domain DACNV
MTGSAYPAARIVASRVHEHFARHLRDFTAQAGREVALLPDSATIEAIIASAFWASLRREEGFDPKISLAFLQPEQAPHPLQFERPLPLDPSTLARIAPAVERPGIHLGVCRTDDGLAVWGTTRNVPVLCFVLEVAAPGLLVVKHHRGEELSKFVNVAVLEGDQIKIIDERAAGLPDCPALLTSMLGVGASWSNSVNVLVQLAVSMRAHQRGGSILIVPSDAAAWAESIVQPVAYAVSPPFAELAALIKDAKDAPNMQPLHHHWQEMFNRAVEALAGLTAVDGATIITDRFEVLAFGAKIARRDGLRQVEQVVVTEPIEGDLASVVHPAQLGGTRHLSAAQFVQDQPDAIALVASQDGRLTVFAWSPREEMVHAHRIETLLL